MVTLGKTGEQQWIVTRQHLASTWGSGLADVLATPVLIGFCEEACRGLVDEHLPPSQQTVGTSVCFHHIAATPLGMRVTVHVEIIRVDGRKLTFRLECQDEHEPIGHGEHTRFVVDSHRFAAGVERKLSGTDS